jgi:signal transduction histidine kinase
VESDCFGFFSIQQRLHPLGGHVHVESAPRHGTRVTLIAPLERGGEETKVKEP